MNDLSNPNPIAADAPERPLPASLRRNAPLVPVDSAGGRALAAACDRILRLEDGHLRPAESIADRGLPTAE